MSLNLNPFGVLRAWARAAVLAGIGDAVEEVKLSGPPPAPLPERLAALPPHEAAAKRREVPRG